MYETLTRTDVGELTEAFVARARVGQRRSDPVLLKRLLPHLARDPKCVDLLRDEARLAALLEHPGIVRIVDHGEEEGVLYIALEYLVGESLAGIVARCRERDTLAPARFLLTVVSAAASALHYAHTLAGADGEPLQIIHRDIRPQNILVSDTGHTKLAGFGMARARNRVSQTEPGALRGRLLFLAPEYLRGEPIDQRVDIYGLGLTLFVGLTGKLPVNPERQARIAAGERLELPLVTDLQPDASSVVAALVARATAPDPNDRFATAADLHAALAAALATAGGPMRHEELARTLHDVFGAAHFAAQRALAEAPARPR